MGADTKYTPFPFVYSSRGLAARWEYDRVPEGYFIQDLNVLEREEESVSSRYGYTILNRDPNGTMGGQNYLFASPIVSIAKMYYQGNPYRFVVLANGELFYNNTNVQGQFAQLTLPETVQGQQLTFSGTPLDWLISACFETALPYIFFYDSSCSVKVAANPNMINPQLTGIDPSPYTLNVNPYAPLLLMIEPFPQSGSNYAVTDISGWGWGNVETLNAESGQLITDFTQFFGIGPSGGGTTIYPAATNSNASVTQTNAGQNTGYGAAISGFPGVVPTSGETVSLTLTLSGSGTILANGVSEALAQYSPDGGNTWLTAMGSAIQATGNIDSITTTIAIMVANLGLLQVRAEAFAVVSSQSGQTTTSSSVTNVYAAISNPAAFGPVVNGMLSNLNTNKQAIVPISSVTSADEVAGVYQQLAVVTHMNHGLSASDTMAIYASSNDLADGFYPVEQVTASNAFLIPFLSATQIGAQGGYVTYAATSASNYSPNPPYCVLSNQYSSPYPTQMSAWGFYEWVPPTTSVFPIGAWSGSVTASSTGSVTKNIQLDLNQNNQVTDADLIVLTLLTDPPENISQITLTFYVGQGGNNYYQAFISPAYFQGAVAGTTLAYQATQNQILADALNLITGQTPGTTSAQLQPTNLSSGSNSWQACLIPRGNFLPVGQAGQAGLDWANVTGWQLSVTTNSNGPAAFSVNGLYLQWGYGPSSFAGVGYDWRYTYYNANTGTESSPCVTGDTWIMTADGPRLVCDLIGRDFKARVNGVDYQTRRGGFFFTGVKPVFYLKTTSGFSLKATAEHEILTATRVTPDVIETEWRAIDELKPGDKIVIHNHRKSCEWPGFGDEDDGYLIGMLIGDGHFNAYDDRANIQTFDKDIGSAAMRDEVTRILRKKGVANQFKGGNFNKKRGTWTVGSKYIRELAEFLGLHAGNKVITPQIETCSSAFYIGLIRGLFDTDGMVSNPRLSADKMRLTVRLNQANESLLNATQRLLLRLGITSNVYMQHPDQERVFYYKGKGRKYIAKAYYLLDIAGDDADLFYAKIGFIHSEKQRKLRVYMERRIRSAVRDRFLVTVKHVIPCGDEPVFDCTVPKVHFFDANGIAAHNCPEQAFNADYGYLASTSAPIYLRQAAQCVGFYSNDPQVTHVRLYRRGGILASNWVQVLQAVNVTGGGQFTLKDVIGDSYLLQAPTLVLDNDPPVTSSLTQPWQFTLADPTNPPGDSIYSFFQPQIVSVVVSGLVIYEFAPNMIVEIGNANNLELVSIIQGGSNQFAAIVRLQHNQGEPVNVYAVPRQPCNLCCIANLPGGSTQVLLAGDKNNPARVYYSKPNQPESFGPEDYLDSPTPNDAVMALINWRGTALVATQSSWYVFIGGAQPYLQPTGAAHGIVASQGWCLVEGEIFFLAADGWRAFSGADGKYMTLPVEWLFRTNPECLPPQVNANDASQTVFAYYNNQIFGSYISLNDGVRYRLIWDVNYQRFRQDDIGATAMLWERDTNLLLCGVPIYSASDTLQGYALVADQQYNQDYDDGGWSASSTLIQTPIDLTIQLPFKDLGKPHFPKQFNVLETDANTQNQPLQTTLYFNTEPQTSIVLPAVNSGSVRQKIQQQISDGTEQGDGYQAYAMSIKHTMSVTVAPTLFQENIYAAILADYRSSFDSYWQKASMNELKLWKEGRFDYSCNEPVEFSIYANGNLNFPYFTFTLPVQAERSVVRVLFLAYKCRLWRMIGVSTGNFQLWAPVQVDNKPLQEGSAYTRTEYGVYE